MPSVFVNIWIFLVTSFNSVSGSQPKGICSHSPTDRACWGKFDLSTNYYEEVPYTGVTREYWLNIVNTTAAPDGNERVVLTVNGTIPGPTIIADWGDEVVVHVKNSMKNNGTGIHFHGIRQNGTNYMDGVPAVTQCPIAPGDSFTYRWRASQYGSTWYHSHFAVQAWDGVQGGLIINGPATQNYDVDKGTILFNDWSPRTAPVLALESQRSGPPEMSTTLINGTGVFNGKGERFSMRFDAGKSYRLRLVNSAANSFYRVSIDEHIMTVISNDLVAIKPYNTTNLAMGNGQRYDVVVHTKKTTRGSFWFRITPQTTCSNHTNPGDVRGIIRYGDNSDDEPNSTPYNLVDACADENPNSLVPKLPITASAEYSVISKQEATLQFVTPTKILWAINNSSFVSRWDYPTIKQVYEGNDTFTRSQNLIKLPKPDEWFYLIITTNFTRAHPIHMHGHDFFVLAAGVGNYSDKVPLQLENSPRRDVAMLPGLGYLVLAIVTDNPGAWLAHCHIAWHASEGFALQLLERESEMLEIEGLLDKDEIEETCENWESFSTRIRLQQDDSGI